MGMKRKGNQRFKPIKVWSKNSRGQKTVYIRNEKPFKYTSPSGQKGVIFALSRAEANKKLKLSFKQKRYQFGSIVVFARNRKEAVRRARTERRRRMRTRRK